MWTEEDVRKASMEAGMESNSVAEMVAEGIAATS
jgi:hypothetical protein